VIAPALFQRFAPVWKPATPQEDIEVAKTTKKAKKTKASELIMGDIRGNVQYPQDQPQVKQDAFGCIGFCFWRSCALLPPPRCQNTASFYGAGIATETPAVLPQLHQEINGTLYAFFWHGRRQHPSEQ